MYVRDHMRPEFHKAIGMEPTDYDFAVFRITNEISKQVFPLTLDIDNPKFRSGLDRLWQITEAIAAAKAKGGAMNRLRRFGLSASAVFAFLRLYCLSTKRNELPKNVSLAPAW